MSETKKILVVEDDLVTQRMLSARLEITGYDVITASDGEEALNKARKENPDLLILDLMLPKMTGYEVCRMLKFDDKYKKIPIIILSSLDQQDEREKAVKAGADTYVIKPFDLELLLVKIKDFIG
ncbi:MAG: response regulator [Candidatus Omnitrophica bacterium]|nr:response regulator [Candidatus Omnitrophota bacterium]